MLGITKLTNYWMLFFMALPVLCIVALILSKFYFKKGARITGVSSIRTPLSFKGFGYSLSIGMIIAGLIIMAFSLTNPLRGYKKEQIKYSGIDIMVALDVSGSMLTPDANYASRLEASKKILKEFISKRKGDRIGLVTFNELSGLKCPSTSNHIFLNEIISSVKIDRNDPSGGTAIGIGLASAMKRLKDLREGFKDLKPESQIVILVTDGVNNSGEISPETSIDIAKKLKIKVYTIGIGSYRDIDMKLLEKIAADTGGNSYHAKTSSELSDVFDSIDTIEKFEYETEEWMKFNSVGYRVAAFGVILLLLGIVFNSLVFRRLG